MLENTRTHPTHKQTERPFICNSLQIGFILIKWGACIHDTEKSHVRDACLCIHLKKVEKVEKSLSNRRKRYFLPESNPQQPYHDVN